MKPASSGRFLFVFFCSAIIAHLTAAQPMSMVSAATAVTTSHAENPMFNYVGSYWSDGTYHPVSAQRQRTPEIAGATLDQSAALGMRPRELPPFVDLHPLERVVEDYEPPAHAMKKTYGHSVLGIFRDQILTFVYGRERALLAPRHVTVDSRGRAIVSDPKLGAVHVLDGKNSFRIPAGLNRRLHTSMGVAVDAGDNIYVADPDRGLVVVFDPSGAFLRNIGTIDDESIFYAPTDLAIDRATGYIYLLDTPRDMLFVLDLQGNVLQRVGRSRGKGIGRFGGVSMPLDFDEPTAIALAQDRVAVVDSSGSRVRIMDLQFQVLSEFMVRPLTRHESNPQIALGFDSARNLYVSNMYDSSIRIYDQAGRLVTSFGHTGSAIGEFSQPSGLWIDSADRVYIADTNNRRIQIFEPVPRATEQ